MHLCYLVKKEDNGLRAVDVLRRRTGMSGLMCKRVRLYGKLLRNGQAQRMIDPVQTGDRLDVFLGDETAAELLRNNINVDIRYRDNWLLVANKPAGMVTHPNWMYHRGSLTDTLSERPLHPVTRLDKDTSGAVLIALNGHAHHVIVQSPMNKEYIALVHGRFRAAKGLIQAPVKRAADSIIERIISVDGAPARTRWQELRFFPAHNASLMRFYLLTGRTHQIRLHCLAAGHPLLGDSMYGPAKSARETELDIRIGRQALHASKIIFHHPVEGHMVTVSAPLPADMRDLIRYMLEC